MTFPSRFQTTLNSVLCRASFVLAVGSVSSSALLFAATPRPTEDAISGNDEVISLPVFEVNDTRVLPPPEKWLYATLPGFEVLSSLSTSETRRSLQDFALLQSAINIIMPGIQPSPQGPPALLILCGRGDDFSRFVPPSQEVDTYRTNSLFITLPDRTAIVINRNLFEVEIDGDALAALDPGATALPADADADDAPLEEELSIGTTLEVDPARAFYQEYFRYLIRRQTGTDKLKWFEEGMARMLAAVNFSKRRISFGQIGDGFGGVKGTDFGALLSRRALIPLEELFNNQSTSTGPVWSAQCYAFAHMCLYGRGQRFQPAFLRFVARSAREPVTESLFIACFGQDYKAMNSELRGYIDFTDHKSIQFNAKKGESLPEPPEVKVRDATDAESGRLVGETLAAAGRIAEAGLTLVAPYSRGERDPPLLAALGFYAAANHHNERAKIYLAEAVELGVDRNLAYLELSRLQLLGTPTDLSPTQVDAALQPLLQARGRTALTAEWFEQLALIWDRSSTAPPAEQIAWINEGVTRFDRRPRLLIAAARINLRWGTTIVARQIIEYGLQTFTNPATLTVLRELQRKLPTAP
jgi:hypothetical protein